MKNCFQRVRDAARALTTVAVVGIWVAGGASMAADEPHQHSGGFHHSFSQADVWAKEFDDPSRDAWQKPDQVLDALTLDRNALVADIGAGTGYFSVRLAKRVPEGKVFAIDVEPDMLRYLSERAHREHLNNVFPVVANQESPNIPEPVDVILIVDTYHHIDDRLAYFTRLKKVAPPAWTPRDRGFQAGFAGRPAACAPDFGREGHRGAQGRRVLARRGALLPAQAILSGVHSVRLVITTVPSA